MAGFLRRTFGGGNDLSMREQVKEAVAYFVVLMIYADGTVEEAEVQAAMGTMARCGLFGDNTNDDDFRLLQRMERKMNEDAEGNAEEYAAILLAEDWKYTAAAIMTDIMLADGEIDSDELHLLSHLASRVGIDNSELNAMTSTVRALRRRWTS